MYTKVLTAAGIFALNSYGLAPADVEQFVAGVVFGLIQKDDLAQIQTCLKDAQGLETEIEEVIGDFSKGDLTDILKGVELVGKVIQELPADLGDCEGMKADVARIEAWAAIFSNPTKLVQTLLTNVVANFPKVSADATSIVSDFKAAKYYNSGDDIADLLVVALGPVPAQPETLEMTQW